MNIAHICCSIILFALFSSSSSIKWLGLKRADRAWTQPRHCPRNKMERKKYGLVGYHSKLCRRLTGLMPVIMKSAFMTAESCQKEFAVRRWNCSSVLFAPRLRPDLLKGTREQAFVYALSSAAITHQVAKGCVSGELPYCPCGQNPSRTARTDGTFKWKGCSDNVFYGQKVSREWADAPFRKNNKINRHNDRNSSRKYNEHRSAAVYNGKQKRRQNNNNNRFYGDMTVISMKDFMRHSQLASPRARMNQHNNDVGRLLAEQMLYRKCKCHGVSSSCSLRTCWNTLPTLAQIAHKLKQRYMQATEVRAMRKWRPEMAGQAVAWQRSVSRDSLVYIRKSPDYCTPDRRVGSLGTHGRLCNATSSREDSCDTMCCGRGYTTVRSEQNERCQCKYVHCCYVKCKICHNFVRKHYCK